MLLTLLRPVFGNAVQLTQLIQHINVDTPSNPAQHSHDTLVLTQHTPDRP